MEKLQKLVVAQRNIVTYLKCTVDEDNVEFEKIHKVITKIINNWGALEKHIVIYKWHECVM